MDFNHKKRRQLGIFLSIMIFAALLQPEAQNHNYSVFTISFFEASIYLAEILLLTTSLVFLFRRGIIVSLYTKPILVLVLISVIATIRGFYVGSFLDTIRELRGILFFSLLVVFSTIYSEYFSNRERRHTFFVLYVSSFILALIVLIYGLLDPTATTFGSHAPGRLQYKNAQIATCIVLAVGSGYALTAKTPASYVLFLCSLVLCSGVAFVSKGTMLWILIVIVLSTALIIFTFEQIPRVLFYALSISLSIIGIVVLLPVLSDVVSNNTTRFVQMRYAMREILLHPLSGNGFGHVYELQVDTWRRSAGSPMSRPADSTLLSFGSSTGIIGLIVLLSVFFRHVRVTLSLYLDNNLSRFKQIVVYTNLISYPAIFIFLPLFTAGFLYSRVPILQMILLISVTESIWHSNRSQP